MPHRVAAAAVILLVLVTALRPWLEDNMARHMLIEFPLLLFTGGAIGSVLPARTRASFAPFNQYGLTGFVIIALSLAVWMIPAALDAALLSGTIAVVKCASLIAGGFLAPASFAAAPLAVQAFFIGNVSWMMATVGLLYQNAERQLCLYYLVDMQRVAGQGLVVASVAIVALWCAGVWRQLVGDQTSG